MLPTVCNIELIIPHSEDESMEAESEYKELISWIRPLNIF